MEKVFPVRFYGDGAEAFALNSFEMLTMISVAPKHSSSLKTRFVFLENNGCANFESVYITSNVSCGTLSFIYSHVSSEVYLHIYSWIDVFWFFKGTCEALHSELQLHKWCRSLPTDETDSLVFYCIAYLLWPLWELWNPLTFFGVFFSQKKMNAISIKSDLGSFHLKFTALQVQGCGPLMTSRARNSPSPTTHAGTNWLEARFVEASVVRLTEFRETKTFSTKFSISSEPLQVW